MLPSAEAVEKVYLDPKTGIFAAAASLNQNGPRKLAMECGTVAQACIDKVYSASKPFNLDFIDAPVSGGPMGSETGTLSFMVGCDKSLFPQIKSILDHMGTSIFRCGDVGTGAAFKIINNYISIISVLSVSEALNIGSKMNLDMHLLIELINSSSGQCWVSSKNNPVPGYHPNAPASNNYAGGFRIELAEKVLDLGRQLAEQVGARTTLDKSAIRAFHEAAGDERYAGKDARVVYKWLNEQSTQAS
jgi:3-hydroxyisobutyrate/3-hydroxypropionate dehydrogenase